MFKVEKGVSFFKYEWFFLTEKNAQTCVINYQAQTKMSVAKMTSLYETTLNSFRYIYSEMSALEYIPIFRIRFIFPII